MEEKVPPPAIDERIVQLLCSCGKGRMWQHHIVSSSLFSSPRNSLGLNQDRQGELALLAQHSSTQRHDMYIQREKSFRGARVCYGTTEDVIGYHQQTVVGTGRRLYLMSIVQGHHHQQRRRNYSLKTPEGLCGTMK